MKRDNQFFRSRVIVTFSLVLIIMLAGCGEVKNNTPVPFCTPVSTQVNIYRVLPQSWAGVIFEYAYPTIPITIPPAPPAIVTIDEGMIPRARYAAFKQLIKEAEHWSDTETIKLDELSKIRITLTFISPELIQAVFLSDVLKDSFLTSGFQDQLQNTLNGVADRDELLFLLTVTSSNSDNINLIRHKIKIPIGDMRLNNAENLFVQPTHDDHNLEQIIDTTSGPVFGYLAYPLTIFSGGQCKWVLDPKYNTNIVISVPYIEVDGVNREPFSWTISYTSLIDSILPSEVPDFNPPAGFDTSLITPMALPPTETSQIDYWQNFAMFVWGQLTLGKY